MCKQLDAETYTDASVIKAAGQFVPIKVNAKKDGKEIADHYDVHSFPRIKFVDANGDVFGEIIGFLPPKDFIEAMTTAQEIYKDYPAAKKTIARNPNDGAANVLMARVDAVRKDAKSAAAALSRAEAAHYHGSDFAKGCNAVGDVYQMGSDFKTAIGYFKKGLDASTSVADKAYSLVSIMSCYDSEHDMDNAKKYAKQLKALVGAPKDYVDYADEILGGK
ncbi:MAG TPA: hypothetical protein VNI20_12865 [Fimbriimonadaceae bacterium]|nr:hypothetical protein [Fimbriimonadaceae bacterium]